MNIEGKYLLNAEEAAFYCSVSVRKFYEIKKKSGLEPMDFFGCKRYRKGDLQHLIETHNGNAQKAQG